MDQQPGIVRIGNERLAAGLFWQPAPTAAAAAREARIVAGKAELAADLFCVRRRGTPQFGLGQRQAGHRPGLRAAAAVLANGIDAPSWLGAFRTDGGWMCVMVRQGAVMPDGDLLLADEDEARARLLAELPLGGWEIVFAPSAWAVPGARGDDAAHLLHQGSDARLRPVVRRPLQPILAAAGLLAGGLALWTLLAPAPPRPPARVPDVPVAPPPPPPPWQGSAAPHALILACRTAIESTPMLPGYDLDSVTCGPAGATAAYRRSWGSLAWLPANAQVVSPDRVTVSLRLPATAPERRGEERPLSLDALRRLVWGAAQSYLLDSELAEQPAAGAAAFPGRNAAHGPQAPFRPVKLALGGSLPPDAVAAVLDHVPAFVVDTVVWQSGRWKVKGKAYVR